VKEEKDAEIPEKNDTSVFTDENLF